MHLKRDLRSRQQARKIQIFHSQTYNVNSKKTCAALEIPPTPSNREVKHKKLCPSPLIANLEHLFHFENINFESKMNNRHGYHSTQGNNHSGFVPWYHLVLVKDFRVVKLGMALNGLNSPIKGQRTCIWHHLKSLQKNSKCYKFTKKLWK